MNCELFIKNHKNVIDELSNKIFLDSSEESAKECVSCLTLIIVSENPQIDVTDAVNYSWKIFEEVVLPLTMAKQKSIAQFLGVTTKNNQNFNRSSYNEIKKKSTPTISGENILGMIGSIFCLLLGGGLFLGGLFGEAGAGGIFGGGVSLIIGIGGLYGYFGTK